MSKNLVGLKLVRSTYVIDHFLGGEMEVDKLRKLPRAIVISSKTSFDRCRYNKILDLVIMT